MHSHRSQSKVSTAVTTRPPERAFSLSATMGDKAATESGLGGGGPKLKRRPSKRAGGHKSKKCEDAVQKLKGQLIDKENAGHSRTLLSLLTDGRLSQKAGLFGKGKTSDTILRRKPLWSVKGSRNDEFNKLLHRTPSPFNVGQLSPPPVPSVDHQAPMECSPTDSLEGSTSESVAGKQTKKLPLKEIADRLVEALNTDNVFPDSKEYFANNITELRKIMKQNDPQAYSQLEASLKGSVIHSTPVATALCFPSLSSEQRYCQAATPIVCMDTAQHECSPAPVLPLWQTGYESSNYQTAEQSQDFLDILDTEIDRDSLDVLDTEIGDTVEIVEDRVNSPCRPRMYPHKLY